MEPQDFYDPVGERFTEPQHTGISYSFTADGFFESAYYRAVANRTSTLRITISSAAETDSQNDKMADYRLTIRQRRSPNVLKA